MQALTYPVALVAWLYLKLLSLVQPLPSTHPFYIAQLRVSAALFGRGSRCSCSRRWSPGSRARRS